jgi:phosphopentomutase
MLTEALAILTADLGNASSSDATGHADEAVSVLVAAG